MILACRLLNIEHLPCFTHTLNLAVQDGLKSSDELNDVLLKCKNIARHVRSSSTATTKLREEQERSGKVPPLKLMQETQTRWNSVLYMLKRILEVGEALTLTKLPRAPSPLSAEDIMLIEDIVQILDPFEEATKLMSGDQYTTVSLIVPAVCGIATELNERIEPALKTAVAKEVLRDCLSALHRRMDAYEKTRLTAFATLLDSRMKERAFLDSINAERAKAGFIDELDRRMSQNSPSSEARLSEHREASIQTTQERRILGFLDKRGREPVTPTSNSERLVRQYLEMLPQGINTNPLEFWRSNQSTMTPLCEMALKYLCVPATSVPAERVFSAAGQIVSDRRSRLKGKNVDMLVFLHQNCWLSQN
ncbi:E3 SUMO-protein ligase ZBED1-like [Ixodes scapularis]|uniref:E3 SUMO-protein ligase ZBED1-like n=1 Tax=Ixodes scapularis TaxID=6945 RepID=UPI001A9E66E8|nr:E3 SUMO-protein ligase ZBED1-like [Ixodes scapularis]